ncbi:hypothetical protein AYI68_g6295, partial [Smittium mucronatum]
MLSALLLALSSPPPNRDLTAGNAPLLRLSTLRLFLPVLKTLSVFTAPTVEIICENLTWGLGQEFKESPSKEDTKSSITGLPTKLNNGSKSLPSAGTSVEKDAEASLSLYFATSRQAST